ncbi:adenylyl-sulfate kinase [Oscillatoria laete-virens NRMC-F 0139]|nr:adenylyl-sulfate kinase [Oscillatoria laete-virens]MDL5052990.1 adenylyl-sulfate kinase [Oscillatoria laete-virens NRMC-F 0139]
MNERGQTLDQLKIVIVGHVDHGKSTFIGRLFHDTGSLPEGKYEQLVKIAERRGVPFEWANLMDSLQSERDQNITMDTSQIWFRTSKRQYVIIDAPGHKEFLKNMITGAARADAALLLIAANEGVQEQSRRHGFLLSLLGVKQVAVLVNKMDLIGYDQKAFEKIRDEYTAFLAQIGVHPKTFIPMAAKHGVNVAARDEATAWYGGKTVLETLDDFALPEEPVDKPLRLPLQDIFRFDHRRILAGKIESGRLKVGDKLLFLPGQKTSEIKSIESWNAPAVTEARAGQSVGITLTEQLFVERGAVAVLENAPCKVGKKIRAKIFWMSRVPFETGRTYRLKLATQDVECELKEVHKVIDASTLDTSGAKTTKVVRNDVAEVDIVLKEPLALDLYSDIAETGRFVLVNRTEVSGGGIVMDVVEMNQPKSGNITANKTQITYEDRIARHGHHGGIVWLTGLSGAGKSTIANELEKELFTRGMQVAAIDGDNLRFGLCSNLGFSDEDRSENIRRAAEAARLMAENAQIVIVSLISPFAADRARAREIAREAEIDFLEVYVNAPLEVCEKRDPKHLYKKARAGEITGFTGISAPYEAPTAPDVEINTDRVQVKEAVAAIMDKLLDAVEIRQQGFEI